MQLLAHPLLHTLIQWEQFAFEYYLNYIVFLNTLIAVHPPQTIAHQTQEISFVFCAMPDHLLSLLLLQPHKKDLQAEHHVIDEWICEVVCEDGSLHLF